MDYTYKFRLFIKRKNKFVMNSKIITYEFKVKNVIFYLDYSLNLKRFLLYVDLPNFERMMNVPYHIILKFFTYVNTYNTSICIEEPFISIVLNLTNFNILKIVIKDVYDAVNLYKKQ